MSDAWLRTCERCGQTVDVSEGESEADVAGILLAHLALLVVLLGWSLYSTVVGAR